MSFILFFGLLACPGPKGTPDTGDPEICEERGGGSAMQEVDMTLDAFCLDGLQADWVRQEELWDLEHYLTSPTVEATYTYKQTQESLDALAGTDGDLYTARHELVLMASGLLANLDGDARLEAACERLGGYADCALREYDGSACVPSGPPPPPHGNEPQAFCETVMNVSGSAFSCISTPLSQALSFAALNAGLTGTANLWLTVTAASGTPVDRLWWPAWMAAYIAQAPSMMLFTAPTTTGGSVSGVIVVHEIAISVKGPASQVAAFWTYVDALASGSSATPPSWSTLKIALPSSMRYQVVTGLGSSTVASTAVQTWKPGEDLLLPNGSKARWAFSQLVGIIDPCRVPKGDRETLPTDFCRLRATAWTGLVDELGKASMDMTFNVGDICL